MRRKTLTWLVVMLLATFLPFLCCSCEKEGDDPGDEQPISGDSALKVSNVSDYDSTIYFDDVYIGNVLAHASRQWSVPSGTHEIMFDNAEEDNTEVGVETYTFVAGQVKSIWIDWND